MAVSFLGLGFHGFPLKAQKPGEPTPKKTGRLVEVCGAQVMKFKILKFDVENEEPIRGADGFCGLATKHRALEALGWRSGRLALGFGT